MCIDNTPLDLKVALTQKSCFHVDAPETSNIPHRQLEDRSGVEGEAEEVVQKGSEEVEAEDGVVEVQGKEHFLDNRTCVEFCIFKLKQGHVNRYLDTRKWAGPVWQKGGCHGCERVTVA